MRNLVQEMFARLRGGTRPTPHWDPDRAPPGCSEVLPQAVEHLVDRVSDRLRALPGYARALRAPLLQVLHHVDQMVESMPGSLLCSRDTFAVDPKVNAFFVSPTHLQEVFSQSEEVRRLFEAAPSADECWALLCMEKKERRQPGLALVRGQLQRDVLQTTVSFSEHQVVAPGHSEEHARQALKCCIFNAVLAHLRQRIETAKGQTDDLTARLQMLRKRQRALSDGPESRHSRIELQIAIAGVESELANVDPQIATLEDQLRYLVAALGNPSELLSTAQRPLHLSRLGVKIDEGSEEPGYELLLSEIRIATQQPRIGAMVRFPRNELLPKMEFLRRADLFLSLGGGGARP